jgi:hypothetical protein
MVTNPFNRNPKAVAEITNRIALIAALRGEFDGTAREGESGFSAMAGGEREHLCWRRNARDDDGRRSPRAPLRTFLTKSACADVQECPSGRG